MLTILSSAADAARLSVPFGGSVTKIEQDFDFDVDNRPVVPATEDDSAWEVATMRVTIHKYDTEDKYEVTTVMWGYPLTKALVRSKRAGWGSIYGYRDCAIRWELRRNAALAALAKFGIDVSRVDDGLPTWADKEAEREARMQAWADERAARLAAKEAAADA